MCFTVFSVLFQFFGEEISVMTKKKVIYYSFLIIHFIHFFLFFFSLKTFKYFNDRLNICFFLCLLLFPKQKILLLLLLLLLKQSISSSFLFSNLYMNSIRWFVPQKRKNLLKKKKTHTKSFAVFFFQFFLIFINAFKTENICLSNIYLSLSFKHKLH